MKTAKLVELLSGLSKKQMEDLATGLIWFDGTQAWRLSNALMVAQQERDLQELEREKQFEMMSREADND